MDAHGSVREILLTRRGLVFVDSTGGAPSDDQVRAVELELGALGYVVSARLRERLSRCSLDELTGFRAWACATLLAHRGGDLKHEPLFRSFPEGIPRDTRALWWQKVLVHFLQAQGQPCLFCGHTGTTHVLDPCQHVVCDRCFDGASYSACPSCGRHVDRSSPFFRAAPDRSVPDEKVVFELLDLGASLDEAAKQLFVAPCERKQALSPDDRAALIAIVAAYRAHVLAWLPKVVAVRENVAIVFGVLFQHCGADDVLPVAKRYLVTATDVLRFVAVVSGTDGSLLRETMFKTSPRATETGRFWGRVAALLGVSAPSPRHTYVTIPLRVSRFKVAKLPRSLRRAILGMLEAIPPERLAEDMLRHRSYWVWVGEFVHPHEYAARFPNAAHAFQLVRKKGPDGARAPAYRGWSSRVEHAVAAHDAGAMLACLVERPGELGRRLDHALRLAGDDGATVGRIVQAFAEKVPALPTPMLLTLRSHLSTRRSPAPIRAYWPKGRVAMGALEPDRRATLSGAALDGPERAIVGELLRRFAQRPAFEDGVVDAAMRSVVVPFNERTASASAIALPRGSRVDVPMGKLLRLFLHWCQPEKGGRRTDLDLSVAFYDAAWQYVGVCSYYQLRFEAPSEGQPGGGERGLIAQSAGDLTDAPWPDGATELVDLHRAEALAAGVRYAVVVVNNYHGMPFAQLERAFAGLMLRDDAGGAHFDPRTVKLKFAVAGDNGIFLPLVLDVRDGVVHWLDVQSKGQLEMNNVATSLRAICNLARR